eukprot:94718-Pleurochrysis_carterae.AAC.1
MSRGRVRLHARPLAEPPPTAGLVDCTSQFVIDARKSRGELRFCTIDEKRDGGALVLTQAGSRYVAALLSAARTACREEEERSICSCSAAGDRGAGADDIFSACFVREGEWRSDDDVGDCGVGPMAAPCSTSARSTLSCPLAFHGVMGIRKGSDSANRSFSSEACRRSRDDARCAGRFCVWHEPAARCGDELGRLCRSDRANALPVNTRLRTAMKAAALRYRQQGPCRWTLSSTLSIALERLVLRRLQ